jgi:hypothetical protein
MINIAELLKYAPKGMKLYSPLFGEVEFAEVMDTDSVPIRVMKRGNGLRFDEYGRYMGNQYPDSECLLFPSKDCRTWEGWKPSKPHYDIGNFHAGMPVLVRADNNCKWDYSVFSRITGNEDWQFAVCNGVSFTQCIPYDGNEHLLGTTKHCSEEYINW